MEIVRSDEVMRAVGVKEMRRGFLSMSSVRMLLSDFCRCTSQLASGAKSRAKKVSDRLCGDV